MIKNMIEKICPKCKGKDVKVDWKSGTVGFTTDKYICKKCGYTSAFFPEVDEK
jgi:transposase-like protein